MEERTEALNVIKDGQSDNSCLECAIEGIAQYITSEGKRLLGLGEHKGAVILAPAAFMMLLEKRGL
jgi:predicted nucleic acid-binding protein